jgi:hypothetical protein
MDKRLIENIKPCELSLDVVSKLKPVTFNKKNSKRTEVGLIAQDIDEKLIIETSMNGIQTVNYEYVIPVLINAIKELSEEVTRLKEGKKKK